MQPRNKCLLVIIVIALMFTLSSQPSTAAFYDGKTITVIVAAGAGGGLTRAAQVFIQYMPNHIPGKPKMIIKNIPGGGGTKGMNYMAKRQGEGQVIPAGSTYKIRGGAYFYREARVFPSYLQAGPSFFIEKSKRKMIAEDIIAALELVRWGVHLAAWLARL